MKMILKRYRYFFAVLILTLLVTLVNRELGLQVFSITGYQIREMMLVIPPIFVLLGLLDVWVPKETMTRFMGAGSGLKGILLAFFIGSAAAGPLYGAFPVAAVFMKKGVKFSNVLIFIGAWSTTKIPMLLFEMASMGPRFAATRLLVNIPGIILIGYLIERFTSKDEIHALYQNAEILCNK